MASKDYVKRGSGQRKPSKKTTRTKTSGKKPWRSGVLAIGVVGAFVYGLYTLNQVPEPVKTEVVHLLPKPKPAVKLPPPPEAKWDYVDTLPSREIKVKAKPLVVSKIPYVMQCGAYKTKHQAESRKVDIAFQGLNSNIIKKPGSSWFRVVLGPYKTKRDAEKDKHKLQRVKIRPCAIWKQTS